MKFFLNSAHCLKVGQKLWVNHAFSIAVLNCQGFIGRTPARVQDGSLPEGLNEYPAQLPRLGQLRTRVGSKSLVMQDCKRLPRLITTPEYFGTFGERCLRLPPGLLMFYIAFLLYGLMGLTILDHIYSSFL